jgi:hypothetical protein
MDPVRKDFGGSLTCGSGCVRIRRLVVLLRFRRGAARQHLASVGVRSTTHLVTTCAIAAVFGFGGSALGLVVFHGELRGPQGMQGPPGAAGPAGPPGPARSGIESLVGGYIIGHDGPAPNCPPGTANAVDLNAVTSGTLDFFTANPRYDIATLCRIVAP